MDQNNSSSSKKVLTLFVMIFSLILFFCLFEVILRIFLFNDSFYLFLYPMGRDSVRIDDPYLSWVLKPGKSSRNPYEPTVSIKINSKGFRDDEFDDLKPEGTYRIFCLGDSTTFGVEVNFEETYSNILESTLNKSLLNGKEGDKSGMDLFGSIRHFEVINAGTPGYSSLQGLVFFKRKILKYKPDLITVGYGFNDYTYRKQGMEDKNFIVDDGMSVDLRFYLSKTMVYTLIKSIVGKIDESPVMLPGFETSDKEGSFRVVKDDYIKNLEEIVRIARENGIKVVFISISNLYRKEMHELASELGVPLFDTTDYFENVLPDIREHPEKYDLSKNKYDEELIESKTLFRLFSQDNNEVHYSRYFYIDVIHLNGFGHELVGRELARKLVYEWGMIANK